LQLTNIPEIKHSQVNIPCVVDQSQASGNHKTDRRQDRHQYRGPRLQRFQGGAAALQDAASNIELTEMRALAISIKLFRDEANRIGKTTTHVLIKTTKSPCAAFLGGQG